MNARFFFLPVLLTTTLSVGSPARADVVTDWNEVAAARVLAARLSPPEGARTMAMMHVAMFDAINAVQPRYVPYAFKGKAPAGSSAEAAAAASARTLLAKLFPEQRDAVEAAYTASMAAIPEGTAKLAGIALGEQVASECISMREKDGTGVPFAYRPVTAPGVYVPTMLPASSEWPTVKPFFMKEPAQFRPGPPPALKTAEWAADYNEIKLLGGRQSSARSPEQTEIARFWAQTGVPSWNPVVRQVASAAGLSLIEEARLFALANMAATDAFVAVFDAKYTYNLWRPITAIRNGDRHDNPQVGRDAAWAPLIDTPMHPEYPCAHCISAAAVGTVLASELHGRPVTISMTSATAPGVTRRWTRVEDYMDEVSNARVWAGVHYRFSTHVAADMGRRIGELAVTEYLKPSESVAQNR